MLRSNSEQHHTSLHAGSWVRRAFLKDTPRITWLAALLARHASALEKADRRRTNPAVSQSKALRRSCIEDGNADCCLVMPHRILAQALEGS